MHLTHFNVTKNEYNGGGGSLSPSSLPDISQPHSVPPIQACYMAISFFNKTHTAFSAKNLCKFWDFTPKGRLLIQRLCPPSYHISAYWMGFIDMANYVYVLMLLGFFGTQFGIKCGISRSQPLIQTHWKPHLFSTHLFRLSSTISRASLASARPRVFFIT